MLIRQVSGDGDIDDDGDDDNDADDDDDNDSDACNVASNDDDVNDNGELYNVSWTSLIKKSIWNDNRCKIIKWLTK